MVFFSLQTCSIFYTKRFCIACVEKNMGEFPDEIGKVSWLKVSVINHSGSIMIFKLCVISLALADNTYLAPDCSRCHEKMLSNNCLILNKIFYSCVLFCSLWIYETVEVLIVVGFFVSFFLVMFVLFFYIRVTKEFYRGFSCWMKCTKTVFFLLKFISEL